MSTEDKNAQERDIEEIRERLYFINQYSEVGSLAKSAEWAFVKEELDKARGDLCELRDRLQSVLEELDELEGKQ